MSGLVPLTLALLVVAPAAPASSAPPDGPATPPVVTPPPAPGTRPARAAATPDPPAPARATPTSRPRATAPAARSRPGPTCCPDPVDVASHPAWKRYFRGQGLHKTGVALTVTASVFAGLLICTLPVAYLLDGPSFGDSNPKLGPALTVGLGVPTLVMLYAGISLLVKGARLRSGAALEIFGPPDPGRRSLRVELGPTGFGLRGRF